MKKITFMLVLALSAFGASAQNFYTFSKLVQTYADLQNATSINNGEVWNYEVSGEITIPFAFSFRGETVDRFLFDDDNFTFLGVGVDYETSDVGIYSVYPSNIYLQDRTYSTEVSSSPISYKVEGTAGNHILKLEIKNAGLEDADEYGYDEDHFYMNTQVWLYEVDNAIEIHYGTNNITDIDNITDGDGLLVGLGDDLTAGFVYGNITNPSYDEFTEDTFPDTISLSTYPGNGTVYRFGPAEVAGVPTVKNNLASLYPNPAATVLNIKSGSAVISHYAIYDATGKCIQEKSIAAATDISINVENFASGIYFIAVNGQHLKFVKN